MYNVSLNVSVPTGQQTSIASDEMPDSGATPSGAQRQRRSPSIFSMYGGGSGSRYSVRSTRTFSNDEIDAFNQDLHRKRPKFIGKRQANDDSLTEFSLPEKDNGHFQMATKEGRFIANEKRPASRKFLGRRSSPANNIDDSSLADNDDDDDVMLMSSAGDGFDVNKRSTPRRKFVGKRPANRKFVGKRSSSAREIIHELVSKRNRNSGGKFPNSIINAGLIGNIQSINELERLLQAEKLLLDVDQSEPSSTDHVTESKRPSRKFVGK